MHKALDALGRSEDADFAVHHAAVACEHLLKGYLAGLHPVLVADGRDFASLLQATGHGNKVTADLTDFRSILLPEAYARVTHLHPHLPVTPKEFKAVANARNGVAHIGIHDNSRTRELMTTCVRLVVLGQVRWLVACPLDRLCC
ncbi:hypothetical protein ACWGCW_27045 [Streptomyces sp. NPDC054933]